MHTAAAGISPRHLLPIALDVGCNTQGVREDPFYLGLRQARSVLPLQDTPHPGAVWLVTDCCAYLMLVFHLL